MYSIVADTWNLVYNLTTAGFGDNATLDSRMTAELATQLVTDYQDIVVGQCPGDNDTPGVRGWMELDLYTYLRDLAMYTDIAIAARALGRNDIMQATVQQILVCLQPVLQYQASAPVPCPPPMNFTLTCVRSTTDLYYDALWGGIVNGWFNRYALSYRFFSNTNKVKRFAFDYCQGCDNPQGYYPFNDYGKPFYNDHHFQYGYVLRTLAHIINLANQGLLYNALDLVANMTAFFFRCQRIAFRCTTAKLDQSSVAFCTRVRQSYSS